MLLELNALPTNKQTYIWMIHTFIPHNTPPRAFCMCDTQQIHSQTHTHITLCLKCTRRGECVKSECMVAWLDVEWLCLRGGGWYGRGRICYVCVWVCLNVLLVCAASEMKFGNMATNTVFAEKVIKLALNIMHTHTHVLTNNENNNKSEVTKTTM